MAITSPLVRIKKQQVIYKVKQDKLSDLLKTLDDLAEANNDKEEE